MTRKQALACIRAYAAEGNTRSALRVYLETATVGRAAFMEAMRQGERWAETHKGETA